MTNEQLDRILAAIAEEEPDRLVATLVWCYRERDPDGWRDIFAEMVERFLAQGLPVVH